MGHGQDEVGHGLNELGYGLDEAGHGHDEAGHGLDEAELANRIWLAWDPRLTKWVTGKRT